MKMTHELAPLSKLPHYANGKALNLDNFNEAASRSKDEELNPKNLSKTITSPPPYFNMEGKKQDMLQLAEELGINATLNMTVPSIKIAITNSEGYEEEFVKNLYETIIANGKRLEELERAEK
ncbi:hypothetical protein TNCV_2622561 [Trichonephila clavipes]|uniref:Uncharacterized protein n=1 Tax=Trichonephila clavipes TaxID=2585209 RepID=A0A8X7BIX7_TRICX|nr:hypothetical protein TNCV_2622561 [Trichonephila clavipes]